MFVWAWLFCSISLFLQQIATALIIHFGQILGVSKRKDFSMATGRKLLPLSIFYNANVAFALASLKGVNIPMYIAIKRLTPLAVLVAGCLRGKGKPPTQVSAFFLVILFLFSTRFYRVMVLLYTCQCLPKMLLLDCESQFSGITRWIVLIKLGRIFR